jgi:hypothetical protein
MKSFSLVLGIIYDNLRPDVDKNLKYSLDNPKIVTT